MTYVIEGYEFPEESCENISEKQEKNTVLNIEKTTTMLQTSKGHKLEVIRESMTSFVVPEFKSTIIRVRCLNFSGKFEIRDYPFEKKDGIEISSLRIEEYESERYGIYVNMKQDEIKYEGIYVYRLMDKWKEPVSLIDFMPVCVKSIIENEEDELQIYKYFVCVKQNKYENPGERVNHVISTMCMLPLEYWYQQQQMYVLQKLNTQ